MRPVVSFCLIIITVILPHPRFEGVTSESLVKEFLGPAPSGFDKIKGGDGSFKNRGALDIDTNMEASVGFVLRLCLNITGNVLRRA